MKRFRKNLSLRFVKTLNIILISLPFISCFLGYYSKQMAGIEYSLGNVLVIGLFIFLYIIFARIYDAFLISINRISEMIYSQVLAILISDTFMFVVIWILCSKFPNVVPILVGFCAQFIFSVLWSVLAHKWYYSKYEPKKTTVVYSNYHDIENLIHEYKLEKKFKVERIIALEECIRDINILSDTETVFICGTQSHYRNMILKYCIDKSIEAYVMPRLGDIILSGARKMHMFHLPIMRVSRSESHPEQIIIKRLFDIISSSVLILLTSPVMIITALAIRLSDGGPALYKQKRLTKNGKIFTIYKFRSMKIDAEKDGVARLSTGDNDDRITKVGKVIRKLRIDELPQLFNIFLGDMSVVGPRPERPEIAAQYEEQLPEFRLRLQVKAGLTGYAQVYGKYNTTPYNKLQMDLMYIANVNLLEDLRIIFATIKIIFLPESTDGVALGQTTEFSENDTDTTPKLTEINK